MRRPRYTLISIWPFLLNKLGYATQLKLINAKLAKKLGKVASKSVATLRTD